ncbi:hypothetical protein [Dawidia soli]|uniref:Uncharacterized protein n=1 Tax=Dawidia soli TaxID=2782352 RepID=A0AAP2DH09_9BACT|nr:hypothetical protein [Dawidia soli]MBT1689217.1 hypothetical protein [Dawidia soli]
MKRSINRKPENEARSFRESASTFRIVDNRPEALQMRRLQALANNNPTILPDVAGTGRLTGGGDVLQRIPREDQEKFHRFCGHYRNELVQDGPFLFVAGGIHSQKAAGIARRWKRDIFSSDLHDNFVEAIAQNYVVINGKSAAVRIPDENSRLAYQSVAPMAMNGEVDMTVFVRKQGKKMVLDRVDVKTIVTNPVFYRDGDDVKRVDATADIVLKGCIKAALLNYNTDDGTTGYKGWWDIEEATPTIVVREIVNAEALSAMQQLLKNDPGMLARFLHQSGHPEFQQYIDGADSGGDSGMYTFALTEQEDLNFVHQIAFKGPVLAASRMLGERIKPVLTKVEVKVKLTTGKVKNESEDDEEKGEYSEGEYGEERGFEIAVKKMKVKMRTKKAAMEIEDM